MAKIYDALRRAEESRRRQRGHPDPEAAPLDWEPGRSAPQAASGARWKRWLSERRDREATALADSGDINKRRIALLQPDSYVAEQFRALRGRIDAMAAERPMRTVVITSANPGDGKTTASINLAIVTALSLGRRVLLIDCDLRKPKVHHALGLRPEAGLAEVLTSQASLDEAIVKVEGVNLEVLAVRGRPPNPSELLSSSNMRELIEEVGSRYDRVILDTPAAMGLPDAKAVSGLCDGVVVVARADVTPQEDIQTTLELVDRSRVLGFVLNGAHASQGRYGYAS